MQNELLGLCNNIWVYNNRSYEHFEPYMTIYRDAHNIKLYKFNLYDNLANVMWNWQDTLDGSCFSLPNNNWQVVFGGPDYVEPIMMAEHFQSYVSVFW